MNAEPAALTQRLLSPSTPSTWADQGRRLAAGVGLAALFGASLGLRHGGGDIPLSALGASAGMLAVAAVAVPAFAIVLALAGAPIDATGLADATTRATAKAGLVLGGLAPAAALYVVTVEESLTVTIVGLFALLMAGAIAARSFYDELSTPLAVAPPATRRTTRVAMAGFLLFAAGLAARVWWMALPALRGGL